MRTDVSGDAAFQRIALDWLADGPTELSGSVLVAALDEIHRTPQRRGRTAAWGARPMRLWQQLAAAALIVALVGSGGYLALIAVEQPAPSATPASAAPTASTRPSGSEAPKAVSYEVDGTSFALALDDSWTVGRAPLQTDLMLPPGVVLVHRGPGFLASVMGLGSVRVRSPGGPAAWSALDPWPADPAAWLTSFPDCRVIDVESMTVDGRPATGLSGECDVADDATSGGGLGPGLIGRMMLTDTMDPDYGWLVQSAPSSRFRITEVRSGDNAGLVIAMTAPRASFDDAVAALGALLAGLTLE